MYNNNNLSIINYVMHIYIPFNLNCFKRVCTCYLHSKYAAAFFPPLVNFAQLFYLRWASVYNNFVKKERSHDWGKKNEFDRRVNSEEWERGREFKGGLNGALIEGVRMIDNEIVHNVTLIFVNLSFLCNNSDFVVNDDDDDFLWMCLYLVSCISISMILFAGGR